MLIIIPTGSHIHKSLSWKNTFSLHILHTQNYIYVYVYSGMVCTAEPVEKYLKACSNQAATAAFVYNTGGSKAFSSSAISGKLDNSAHVKMVNSD